MFLRSTSALRALCLATLALLALAWPAFAQKPLVKIAPLLTRSVGEVEVALGKPRHIGEQRERYYKIEGFVRVVVRPTPQSTLATVTFQFTPGTVKDELEALTKVGLGDAVLPDRWTSRWNAPGASKNDELTLSRVPAEVEASTAAITSAKITQSAIMTRHFLERMKERGISEAQVTDVLEHGQRFYDPKNDSYIRYKDGLYIALTKEGVLKTVVRGPIASRWRPL